MWNQVYAPVSGSLALSAVCAALPIFVMLLMLAVLRTAAWKAALAGVVAAILVAAFVYDMPWRLVFQLHRVWCGVWPVSRLPGWCSGPSRSTA